MRATTRLASAGAVEELLDRVDEGSAPTLLLVVDGSLSSRGASRYAGALARRTGGIVVAVCVTEDGPGSGKRVLADTEAIVAEWCVRCDTVLADGDPVGAVAWIATGVRADCVILGFDGNEQKMSGVAEEIVEGCGEDVFAILVASGNEDGRG